MEFPATNQITVCLLSEDI